MGWELQLALPTILLYGDLFAALILPLVQQWRWPQQRTW